MTPLIKLVAYTNALLKGNFQDYCPNGLQVEGRPDVGKLVSGVTASLALLEAAAERGADAVLVHHGYFWRSEAPTVTGMKRRRLQFLLTHDLSLLAYHLPLDDHPVYGNNAQLGNLLGMEVAGRFGVAEGPAIGCHGRLTQAMSGSVFAEHVNAKLGRAPLHVPGRAASIDTIGWCTGAAQAYIEQAAAMGLDAYLTGEVSEQTVHVAREMGIHFFAAGHHATERYGAKALGEHLAEVFDLQHEFIDVDNPA